MPDVSGAALAAMRAMRAYPSTLKPARTGHGEHHPLPDTEEASVARVELDGEAVGRLVAPVVSRLLAREIRERRRIP